MKKIFLFALGILSMTAIHAANTEVARITITGQGGTESSYVTLRVDPSISANETASYLGATEEEGQVNIYAIVGSDKYAAFKSSAISELELQFITNRRAAANQHYVLSFNVPTLNEGLTLYDSKTNTYTPITNGASYEFDVNTTLHPDYVEGQNYVVAGRFFVNHAASAGPSICFSYNVLEINAHAGESLVVKQGDTEIANEAALPAVYSLDLSAYNGRLVVTLNGQDYQIDANPAVQKVNP